MELFFYRKKNCDENFIANLITNNFVMKLFELDNILVNHRFKNKICENIVQFFLLINGSKIRPSLLKLKTT